MATDLVFPRLVYRGLPDTLGQGTHTNDAGQLVGETLQVDSQDALDAATTAGWRLTREIAADVAVAADDAADATPAKKAKK